MNKTDHTKHHLCHGMKHMDHAFMTVYQMELMTVASFVEMCNA